MGLGKLKYTVDTIQIRYIKLPYWHQGQILCSCWLLGNNTILLLFNEHLCPTFHPEAVFSPLDSQSCNHTNIFSRGFHCKSFNQQSSQNYLLPLDFAKETFATYTKTCFWRRQTWQLVTSATKLQTKQQSLVETFRVRLAFNSAFPFWLIWGFDYDCRWKHLSRMHLTQ